MSGEPEFTGTELAIMRAAIFAYDRFARLEIPIEEVTGQDVEGQAFHGVVTQVCDAVAQAIGAEQGRRPELDYAKLRLIGEVATCARNAAETINPRDEFSRTELAEALLKLGQAIGHVEVVFGGLGKISDELFAARLAKIRGAQSVNERRSSWHDSAIAIFESLSRDYPERTRAALYQDAIVELDWQTPKGKIRPTADALRKEIAKRKQGQN